MRSKTRPGVLLGILSGMVLLFIMWATGELAARFVAWWIR